MAYSVWEKEAFTTYDLVVVGAGFVGLSTAAAWLERYPKARVAVVERNFLPTGASTKNAGFACFGSLTEILADLQMMNAETVFNLVQSRYEGLQLLRQRLGDSALDLKQYGGYELLTEAQMPALAELDKVNDFLKPIFEKYHTNFEGRVFRRKDGTIASFKFNAQKVRAMVYTPFEGQINSGMAIRNLWQYVAKRGALVWTGVQAIDWQAIGSNVELHLQPTSLSEPKPHTRFSIQAKKIAICTNAFAKEALPTADIQAGRGLVLITKPISSLPFKGTFHLEAGFYYFRNLENRVIFGGGRNLDFEAEKTTQLGINPLIAQDLENKLKTLILPQFQPEIDYFWSGIMAFGREKSPLLVSLHPNVAAGVRLSGMGVALSSKVALDLVSRLSEDT
ncbi:NAD(P)/FAD-dependent oxidoreductase [Hugenholtzia roseola]|uniref:NAD(P)/FAD-dependent oxidoreductase n=1 Tax=Hugenholtzia roseola TaxID=1002 RepID=UPI0003FBE28E|nr:FAD-dependent oxidoreductase [Hugenholtzia roseola]